MRIIVGNPEADIEGEGGGVRGGWGKEIGGKISVNKSRGNNGKALGMRLTISIYSFPTFPARYFLFGARNGMKWERRSVLNSRTPRRFGNRM